MQGTSSDLLAQPPKQPDQVRAKIRLKNYPIRNRAGLYALGWAVSASTQNQALSALLFLYKGVLGIQLPWLDNAGLAKSCADNDDLHACAEQRRQGCDQPVGFVGLGSFSIIKKNNQLSPYRLSY